MRKWSTSRSIRSIHSNTDYWFVNKRPFVAGFFLPFSPISISICIHYPPLPVSSLSPNPASSEPNWNFRADERPRIYTNILNEIKQFLNQVFRFPVRGKRRFRGKRFPIPIFLYPIVRIVRSSDTRKEYTKQSESWIGEDACENFSQPFEFCEFASFSSLSPFQLFSIPRPFQVELFPKNERVVIIRKTHTSQLERANRDINSRCVSREFDFDKLGSKDAERGLFLFYFIFCLAYYPPLLFLFFSFPSANSSQLTAQLFN